MGCIKGISTKSEWNLFALEVIYRPIKNTSIGID